jgi:glucose/arabinose dehydrogenase
MQPQQAGQPDGQGAAHQHRRQRAKRQPVRRPRGRAPEIFALGFRDPQGLAVHPKTGRIFTSEHGPRGGDEINEVEKGKNYGFPVIGYGRDYTGKPINNDKTAQAGDEQPVYFWTPDIAPAGIAFYTARCSRRGTAISSSAVSPRSISCGSCSTPGKPRRGRGAAARGSERADRGVQEGPDGALYVLTDGANGKILRLRK